MRSTVFGKCSSLFTLRMSLIDNFWLYIELAPVFVREVFRFGRTMIYTHFLEEGEIFQVNTDVDSLVSALSSLYTVFNFGLECHTSHLNECMF